jgi:hypothetical protein
MDHHIYDREIKVSEGNFDSIVLYEIVGTYESVIVEYPAIPFV